MRRFLFAATAALIFAAPSVASEVNGEYVEARSASVYAGACHFNGEMTTAGREAVLAFRVDKGAIGGVPLSGLSVVAVVSGNANLADADTARRSVVYVSDRATAAQRDALVRLIRTKAGATLGEVVAVKSAAQKIAFDAKSVRVTSGDGVKLEIARYKGACCLKMPQQQWYTPFVQSPDALPAQGTVTGYKDATLGIVWSQETSDNAFVGTFSL